MLTASFFGSLKVNLYVCNMQKTHKIKKEVPIDLDKYVNTETGEVITAEVLPNSQMVVKTDTGLRVITSENYSVIDTEAILCLSRIINNSDLGNVIKMSVTTKTPLNLIYNHNVPHSNETLQKYLEIKSESKLIDLLKRLMKAGILYQLKGKIQGEVRVIYMINPFLSRKRKTFEDKVFETFEKFRLECPGCLTTQI